MYFLTYDGDNTAKNHKSKRFFGVTQGYARPDAFNEHYCWLKKNVPSGFRALKKAFNAFECSDC